MSYDCTYRPPFVGYKRNNQYIYVLCRIEQCIYTSTHQELRLGNPSMLNGDRFRPMIGERLPKTMPKPASTVSVDATEVSDKQYGGLEEHFRLFTLCTVV